MQSCSVFKEIHNGISTLDQSATQIVFFFSLLLFCFPPEKFRIPRFSVFPWKIRLEHLILALVSKVGSMFLCCSSSNKYKRLDAKLGRKMLEVKKNSTGHDNFKSLNGIILRFPQFKEGLQNIRGVFEQYDEDSNGSIDRAELKKCLQQLQMHMTEEEVEDLFRSCDIDGSSGIQFNEFIVLLCLIYLLKDEHSQTESKLGSPQLEATFDTIIQAFIFLDKNGDGKLNKKEMVKALNEGSPSERSPARITKTRFKEMDWNNSGKVNFREFLFGFINWVGIGMDDDLSLT